METADATAGRGGGLLMHKRDGCTQVFFRDGSYAPFPLASYAEVRDAWMNGRTFYEGADLYGAFSTVKFAEVNCVRYASAESWRLAEEDERSEKLRESFE